MYTKTVNKIAFLDGLDIGFLDGRVRRLCTDSRWAERKLGKPCAKKLRARLADLQAAAHVAELPAGRPHPLKGNRAGQFALSLHGGKRLVFEPNHNPVPQLPNGGVAWIQVTRINIVFIGDYHD